MDLKRVQQQKEAAKKSKSYWDNKRKAQLEMAGLGDESKRQSKKRKGNKSNGDEKMSWTLEEILERDRECGVMTKEAELIGKTALLLTNKYRAEHSLQPLRWW